jgi:hypothetical protein
LGDRVVWYLNLGGDVFFVVFEPGFLHDYLPFVLALWDFTWPQPRSGGNAVCWTAIPSPVGGHAKP